jgi:nucleotidyltransferase substrate binding protein (TIGR01987 family)
VAIDLTTLEKAVFSLEEAFRVFKKSRRRAGTAGWKLLRDGVIQRFEYTFELSWKFLRRYLEEYGLESVETLTNRELFRVGHEQGLIDDAEAWIGYLRGRNLTSHMYSEDIAEQVFQTAEAFLPSVRFLLGQLRERLGD